jgi:5-formyltetrahydrofolate cyclo-ligase
MTKSALRKVYKEKRKQVSPQQAEKYNDLILINFQKIQLPFIACVHTYMAAETLGEADTSLLVRYLHFKNPSLIVLAPRIDFRSGDMHHLHIHDETEFTINQYGIMEPSSGSSVDADAVDLVLVPLLAFDKRGYRVGYGKGFYDKFLSACRDDVLKIGLSFFEPADAIEDVDEYDIPLNYCVTPHQVFEF